MNTARTVTPLTLFAMLTAITSCADSVSPASVDSDKPETTVHSSSAISRGQIVFTDMAANWYGIFVADDKGTRLRRLSPDGSLDIYPAPSPNGERIAFTSAIPNANWFDIYMMNADGTNRVRMTHIDGGCREPVWSPDGSTLVFECNPDRNYPQIFTMKADGTNLTQITHEQGNHTSPEWSPDGKRIIFARDAVGFENKGIFTITPDGSDLRQLTSGHFAFEPTWSPDGLHVAFNREVGTSGNMELFLVNADGSGETFLAADVDWFSGPTWSPDGSRIAFTRRTTSRMCIDEEDGLSYPCGLDLTLVSHDGTIDPNWTIHSASSAAWKR